MTLPLTPELAPWVVPSSLGVLALLLSTLASVILAHACLTQFSYPLTHDAAPGVLASFAVLHMIVFRDSDALAPVPITETTTTFARRSHCCV